MFTGGPVITDVPKIVQLLHSTRESLQLRAVPLSVKRQRSKPYDSDAPPVQLAPTRKLKIRTLLNTLKLPAVKETPVARGEEDANVTSAMRTVSLIKSKSFD
jgi:hypothetical protein